MKHDKHASMDHDNPQQVHIVKTNENHFFYNTHCQVVDRMRIAAKELMAGEWCLGLWEIDLPMSWLYHECVLGICHGYCGT